MQTKTEILDQPFKQIFKDKKKYISFACMDEIYEFSGITPHQWKNYKRGLTEPPRSFKIMFFITIRRFQPAEITLSETVEGEFEKA